MKKLLIFIIILSLGFLINEVAHSQMFNNIEFKILDNGNWIITDHNKNCDFHIDFIPYFNNRTITHNYGCGYCFWLYPNEERVLEFKNCEYVDNFIPNVWYN